MKTNIFFKTRKLRRSIRLENQLAHIRESKKKDHPLPKRFFPHWAWSTKGSSTNYWGVDIYSASGLVFSWKKLWEAVEEHVCERMVIIIIDLESEEERDGWSTEEWGAQRNRSFMGLDRGSPWTLSIPSDFCLMYRVCMCILSPLWYRLYSFF